MTIYIRRINGWLVLSDRKGNTWKYLWYSKRYALSHFKRQFGYFRKRGVEIIDYTKGDSNES